MIIKFGLKIYHANMLKKYYAREDKADSENRKEDQKIAVYVDVLLDKNTPSIYEKSLLELGTYTQKNC